MSTSVICSCCLATQHLLLQQTQTHTHTHAYTHTTHTYTCIYNAHTHSRTHNKHVHSPMHAHSTYTCTHTLVSPLALKSSNVCVLRYLNLCFQIDNGLVPMHGQWPHSHAWAMGSFPCMGNGSIPMHRQWAHISNWSAIMMKPCIGNGL